MKKYLLTLLSLFCLFIIISAQDKPIDSTISHNATITTTTVTDVTTPLVGGEVDQTIMDKIKAGVMDFLKYVNWLFLVVFIGLSWLINDTAEATNVAGWFSWWAKIPKIIRTLIAGIVQIGVFYFLFQYNSIAEVRDMVFALFAGMLIYKFGIDKFLRWVSTFIFKMDFTEVK
jgi:hypothetical protein